MNALSLSFFGPVKRQGKIAEILENSGKSRKPKSGPLRVKKIGNCCRKIVSNFCKCFDMNVNTFSFSNTDVDKLFHNWRE